LAMLSPSKRGIYTHQPCLPDYHHIYNAQIMKRG
jgi:hypothetical protein